MFFQEQTIARFLFFSLLHLLGYVFAVVVESKSEQEENPALNEIYDDEAEVIVAEGFCIFQNQVNLGQLRGQTLGDGYR